MREYIPIASEAADLTTTDHTFARVVHAIRANVDGTFYAKLKGESAVAEASHGYTVKAGDVVLGNFASVQRSTSDAVFHNATTLLGLVLPSDQGY